MAQLKDRWSPWWEHRWNIRLFSKLFSHSSSVWEHRAHRIHCNTLHLHTHIKSANVAWPSPDSHHAATVLSFRRGVLELDLTHRWQSFCGFCLHNMISSRKTTQTFSQTLDVVTLALRHGGEVAPHCRVFACVWVCVYMCLFVCKRA